MARVSDNARPSAPSATAYTLLATDSTHVITVNNRPIALTITPTTVSSDPGRSTDPTRASN